MWKKTLIALLGLTFGGAAYAHCAGVACTNVYIERLLLNASGPLHVAVDGDETALDCTAVSDFYVTLNTSDPNAEAIYSTLLAAHVAGKRVSIRIEQFSADCEIRYVYVDRQ